MADATRRVSVRLSLDDAARVKAGLREVGETGQRSLDQIKGGAERASRSLELLDVAVRGIQLAGVAVAARALVQAGDALTQSLSRLQNATGSVERASQVYEALYRNALSTGVAISESVDAFQRFSIAAREIGATSDQVVRLVGGLQRVAIVSGASTQEISSATLQLAQALASGVLQGDELRSILEAMPLLAEGLAKELGVSIGELRKLGSEGKLTAERVFPALLRATERLGAELDRAPLSLGRAFGQLTAATKNFLGQLDRAIGLSNALARALSAAARAVDGVRQGAGLLSEEERFAGMRRQAEALAAQIARLESQSDGRASLTAPVRRGSIRPGLVGAAEQQAGVDRAARLEELRRQYTDLQAEISRATQVLQRDGARWIAEASFDPLNRTQAGVLEGLLAALAGSANTVRIWDWRREYRTGDPRSQGEVPAGPYSFSDATTFTDGTGLVVGSGTPSLAVGAARGALSLQTQGWWPNAVAVGAGDHIGLAGRLYMATERVVASGTGTATIPIAPPLRAAAPLAEPLVLTTPTVAMRLASDDEGANPTRPGRFTAITIRLEEALP